MSKHTIVGLCGSLRAASVNRKLMLEAVRIYDPATFIDGNLRLPLYDGDLEDQGIPAEVTTLADQIKVADAVIIATPEYNKMIPGVLKNAFDWLSRIKGGVWADKPVAIMAATAGRTGGEVSLYTLRHSMVAFRPAIVPVAAPMIAGAAGEFDDAGRLTNDRYIKGVTDQMEALRAAVMAAAD